MRIVPIMTLNWSIDRSRLFKGAVELSSLFTRDEERVDL